MLRLRGVSKRFDGRGGSVQALEAVNLDIRDGEFMSFVGPSGCGKTTLLKIIDGLVPASEGRLYLDDDPLTGISRELAFVFQDINLFPWRTVIENVEVGLQAQGVGAAERRARALEALGLVGLEESAGKAPYTLSGGMQQRVGVARALAMKPRVLLMDEPFGHLDNFTREQLQIEVSKLWHQLGMTIVFVTHDVDEAIFLSDRIAVFDTNPGRIVEVLDVELPHPRWELDVPSTPEANRLRTHITERLNVRSRAVV